jgi:hypothetical protein
MKLPAVHVCRGAQCSSVDGIASMLDGSGLYAQTVLCTHCRWSGCQGWWSVRNSARWMHTSSTATPTTHCMHNHLKLVVGNFARVGSQSQACWAEEEHKEGTQHTTDQEHTCPSALPNLFRSYHLCCVFSTEKPSLGSAQAHRETQHNEGCYISLMCRRADPCSKSARLDPVPRNSACRGQSHNHGAGRP